MTQFELKALPYAYDALEPYIDEATMKVHHDKHHQAYCDKFNAAIKDVEAFDGMTAEEILADINQIPEDIRAAAVNNGGGYVNHNLFWEVMKKDVAFEGEVAEAIVEKFGSFEDFKDKFAAAAATQFGSGWAWLVVDEDGELEIVKTSNQNTPVSSGKTPILNIDVWEHAYYLKYQNKRPDYIEQFFNVINWEKVNELYLEAKN